jgi:hypothetical protein
MQTNSRAIPRAIAIILVIAALTGAAYMLLYQGPINVITHSKNKSEEIGRSIFKNIDDILHVRPRVTVNGHTITEASTDIAELSTVEKNFEHTHSVESTWLGSTKRHKLKGRFTAKAGFDLNQAITIDISPDGQTIRVTLPPARIHSVEQTHVEIIHDENGIWNKISAEERQQALNALLQDARKSIEETSILTDAQTSFEKQITDIIRKQAPPNGTIIIEPLK